MHQTKHKKSSLQPCEAKKHVTWSKYNQCTQISPDLQPEKIKMQEKEEEENITYEILG